MQKSVSQQPLSCIKEGWGQQTSNKFETSEQFHSIPAFQNGGIQFTTKHAPERTLHVQAGPKRCLLLCSSKKGIKESSSSNIYQNLEGTNFLLEKASDSCDNISGRYVTHVTNTRRVINEQKYKNCSSDSIGICYQFEKGHPSASLINRIFRLGNETISSSKKGGGDFSDISKCSGRQFDLKRFDKVTGEIDFHNSSNFTGETPDSFTAANTNTGPEKKHDLPICDYSGSSGQRGAVMVENQHGNLQWKESVDSTPRSDHIFRCIKEGLGCFVSRDYRGGSMVFSGESLAHKCSRTRSSEASNSFFYKIQGTKINSSTDRQHDSFLFIY